jgi:hypothetical protein
LRLVDHHQHRVPVIPADLEQPVQIGGRPPHLILGIQPFEIEHGGDAMDARALASDLQAALGVVLGIDDKMTESFGQCHEVAFGVDDGLLHPGRALLQQPPQQVRLAGSRIALHQEARRQQFLEVECRGRARGRLPHLDRNGHVSARTLPAAQRLIKPRAARRARRARCPVFHRGRFTCRRILSRVEPRGFGRVGSRHIPSDSVRISRHSPERHGRSECRRHRRLQRFERTSLSGSTACRGAASTFWS